MSDLMKTVQEDFVARLAAAEDFAHTAVIPQHRAHTEEEIAGLLQTQKGRSGRIGTCVLVQLPVLSVVDPNLPGPRTQLVMSATFIEHPQLNGGSQGSGTTAEALAIAGLRLFHHFTPVGVTACFNGTAEAIVPDTDFDALVAYRVTVAALVQFAVPAKVARPTISLADGLATLACATSGAAITYSLDGTYPTLAYTAPLTVAAGTTIRAAATKADHQQSDVAQTTAS